MTETPVLRHLPSVYRRAGETGAAWRLLQEVGTRFPSLERATKQVLSSRFLEHAEHLEDLERLAAPWGIAPWPGETLAAFRNRLRALIPLYLQGQASLSGLLDLVGAAADADRIGPPTLPALPLPPESFTWGRVSGGDLYGTTTRSSDPYTTIARFRPRSGAPLFEAAVVELPPRWEGPVVIPPTGDWTLINQSYAAPGPYSPDGHRLPHRFPDPVIEIAAGPAPVALPIIAQLDLGRLLLINRFLPPGATLAVDLERLAVVDRPGPASLQGPLDPAELRLVGQASPASSQGEPEVTMLFGKADFTGESLPLRHLTWTQAQPEAVSWLPFGLSRWRLLLGVTMTGRPPALGERLALNQIRLVPAWTGDLGIPAPRELQVRWRGRRAGTFTILFRPVGSENWQATGPLLKPTWFREQVERLKPAGTLYLDPQETALLELEGAKRRDTQLALWEEIQPRADVSAQNTLVDRAGAPEERLILTDSVSFTITRPEGKV